MGIAADVLRLLQSVAVRHRLPPDAPIICRHLPGIEVIVRRRGVRLWPVDMNKNGLVSIVFHLWDVTCQEPTHMQSDPCHLTALKSFVQHDHGVG